MDNLEENNKKKSLPYFTTKDNVTKLIEATKLKEGAEESIRFFLVKVNIKILKELYKLLMSYQMI